MEQQNPNHPLLHAPLDIARSTRDVPPTHYTLKIDSFSRLLQILSNSGKENYETAIFEASGYKWKLSLYPNGDKEHNGEGHISLYLVIAETQSWPVGWEVKVNLKLFVFDKVHDTYSIFQDNDGKIRHFHESKRESGFSKLLPLSVFNDPSNGFLSRDKCMFGVEVFVLNYSGRGECLSSQLKIGDIHTWRIDKFSSFQKESHSSDYFTLGNRTWMIQIYPKGYYGEALSLYLELKDTQMYGKAYVHYKLRIRNQLHGKHKAASDQQWFGNLGWGRDEFIKLSDLNNTSMGFLVKDTLIVEAEIVSISCVKKFSRS